MFIFDFFLFSVVRFDTMQMKLEVDATLILFWHNPWVIKPFLSAYSRTISHNSVISNILKSDICLVIIETNIGKKTYFQEN